MKLFISKEVLRNIGKKVKLRPLNLKRSQMTVLNVVQKEDGSKEITPFNFILPVSSLVLEQSEGNVLIDVCGLVVTHKDEKNVETQNDNMIYAIFYQGKVEPSEIYVPVEQKEKIKVLYKIQNQDEWFYIICFELCQEDRVPIYLAYEAGFLVQKILYFECSKGNKLDVKEYNTYFTVNNKNLFLYRPLYSLGGRIIE